MEEKKQRIWIERHLGRTWRDHEIENISSTPLSEDNLCAWNWSFRVIVGWHWWEQHILYENSGQATSADEARRELEKALLAIPDREKLLLMHQELSAQRAARIDEVAATLKEK